MQNSVALYDDLVEGPRMNREETFVRIQRPKHRRERTSSSLKPSGIHRRKNKRCTW
jgi:hypothetical protein